MLDRRRAVRQLLNVLWPNRCPGCDCFLTANEMVCPACAEDMLLDHDACCHVCGKVACRCKEARFAYDRAVVSFAYAGATIPAVYRLKDSQNTNFAHFAAEILAERVKISPIYGVPDCVMSVPMHPSRRRKRGYDQAALIAKDMAERLDLPYRDDVLYRDRPGAVQHLLKNAAERAANVLSFGIRDVPLDGLRVLLVDDVLTTGSTLNRCASLLKQNGAVWVVAAAAATTVPHALQKNAAKTPKEDPS